MNKALRTIWFMNEETNPPRRRRAFTLMELTATAVLMGVLASLALVTYASLTGKLNTDAASGYQSAVMQAEVQFAQTNQGLYTAVAANLPALPHNVTIVNGLAATTGQVSLATDATTGNLGMASTNGAGVCTLAVLTPVSTGATLTTSTAATGVACDGASAITNPQVNPSAPTITSVVPASGAVTVTWTAPTQTGNGTITSYTVVSSPGSFTCSSTTTTCVVSGLTNNTTYTFVVTPQTTAGPGTPSAASTAVTPGGTPTAPQNLSYAYPASGTISSSGSTTTTIVTTLYDSVQISWTAPASNGGSAVTSYVVSSYDSNSNSGPTCTVSAPTTTCTISGLAYSMIYSFTAYAVNANGTGAVSSALTMSGQTYGPPDAPVVDPTTPTTSGTSATVSWDTGNNNGAAISLYTVTSSPDNKTCTTASLTCTVSGLTDGTTYTFSVTATNTYGVGPASDPSDEVTILGVPSAPLSVSATVSPSSQNSATVKWSAPSSDGGATITSYTATSSPGGFTCSTAGTSCTVSSLTKGTAYTFSVRATNSQGAGPAATTASVKTWTDTLGYGQSLLASSAQSIYSANGLYRVIMQADGNLVMYNSSGTALWNSGTHVSSGGSLYFTTMQTDCNLVVYNTTGSPRVAKWNSDTSGKGSTCNAIVTTTGHFQIFLGTTSGTLIKTIH